MAGEKPQAGQPDIPGQRKPLNAALYLPILREISEAMADRIARPADIEPSPAQGDAAVIGPGEAKDALHHFAPPRPHQPVYAQNFTASEIKPDIGKFLATRQAGDTEQLFADRHG